MQNDIVGIPFWLIVLFLSLVICVVAINIYIDSVVYEQLPYLMVAFVSFKIIGIVWMLGLWMCLGGFLIRLLFVIERYNCFHLKVHAGTIDFTRDTDNPRKTTERFRWEHVQVPFKPKLLFAYYAYATFLYLGGAGFMVFLMGGFYVFVTRESESLMAAIVTGFSPLLTHILLTFLSFFLLLVLFKLRFDEYKGRHVVHATFDTEKLYGTKEYY